MLMRKRVLLCCLTITAGSSAMFAGTVTPLREGWLLQSACKLQAAGDVIGTEGFKPDGWLKTTVPSTF